MPPSKPLPTSQRAALYTAPHAVSARVSQVAAVPTIPKTGTNTLVRVLASSINPVDYKLPSLPTPLPRLMIGSSPITPGIDFVGRVWQTNHPDLKAGDLCWGMLSGPSKHGTCADFIVCTGVGGIAKVPDGYLNTLEGDPKRSLDELGGVGVAGITALQALEMGNLPFTQTKGKEVGGKIFINGGSGGCGTFAVQMAKYGMGCETVVASCSGSNADLVRGLGADEVIDYRSQNVVDALKQWSQRNGGQTFDMIIDNVGNDSQLYWQSHNYMKSDGKYVMVGAEMSVKTTIDLMKILLWPTLLGGGKRRFGFLMLTGTSKEQWDLVGKWMTEGKVRTVVEDDNKFNLDHIDKAFQKLKTGRTRGKIIINIAEDGQ